MLSQRRVTMIGIAGDSGAGKSTYAENLKTLLGAERVTVITGDDYHSLNRHERALLDVTALNPAKANNLGLLTDHAWFLRQGRPIIKPIYDHSTGTFTGMEEVEPREIVIIEGLHSLYLEKLREALDLKIYFDTDVSLRVRWKVRRDAGVRGYTEEQVLKEIDRRKADADAFIEPQKAFADLVIHYLPDDEHVPTEAVPEPIHVRVSERMTGKKRRLVKWLALASRLGLINANHYHDEIAGEKMEIASIAGNTALSSMHSLLEMISDNHYVTHHLDELHYDPVSVSRLLVANMISELADNAKADSFWSRQSV